MKKLSVKFRWYWRWKMYRSRHFDRCSTLQDTTQLL